MKWVETISNLKRHIHRKREQDNKQKDELKTGKVLVHVDYSESYNNIHQDEIQSAYFGQQNFSTFTSGLYYCEAERGDLVKIAIAVISESSDHFQIATFTCTNTIANGLEKRLKDSLKKVVLWSDGYLSQFRSKYMFAFMKHFDKSAQVDWHYKEAHHGKGPMDGVGRTIKKNGFWVAKIKQNHDKDSERICNGSFKYCGVHSANPSFPSWWDNRASVCHSISIHWGNSWYSLSETLF